MSSPVRPSIHSRLHRRSGWFLKRRWKRACSATKPSRPSSGTICRRRRSLPSKPRPKWILMPGGNATPDDLLRDINRHLNQVGQAGTSGGDAGTAARRSDSRHRSRQCPHAPERSAGLVRPGQARRSRPPLCPSCRRQGVVGLVRGQSRQAPYRHQSGARQKADKFESVKLLAEGASRWPRAMPRTPVPRRGKPNSSTGLITCGSWETGPTRCWPTLTLSRPS